MSNDQYYLQDKRQYVGNDMLWWADKGGYTTDLNKAEAMTKEKAVAQNQSRETDIPWPKSYIDNKWRPAVDAQCVDKEVALQGTGIVLNVPPKYVRPKHNCEECGRFLTDQQIYCGCPNCGSAP